MQLAVHYLQLRQSFPNALEGESVPISMEEIAILLYCTTRNAKLIMTKMVELGWIRWVPGRGRGHRSVLTFLLFKGDLLLSEAKALVLKGELMEALEQISRYGEGTTVKEQLMDWLSSGYFGYRVEGKKQQRMESLRFPVYRTINTLDPAYSFYAFDAHMMKQVLDTLVRYDRVSQRFQPSLAHHWESNDDSSIWTFYLRRGVTFHHGRELTAEDVVFSFRRLSDPMLALPHNWLFRGMLDIAVLDGSAVQITLDAPNHLFLHYVSFPASSIVPEEVCLEKGSGFARYPVGTGPFKVVQHNESVCVLEVHKSYFQGRAHLDRVEVIMIPDDKSCQVKDNPSDQVMLHMGDPSPVINVEWEELGELHTGCSLLTMNLTRPGPQCHPNFRKALHHLIDRGRMIDELGEPRMYPAQGFFPNAAMGAEDMAFQPEETRRLLQVAGYRGETICLYTYERHAADAYWIQEQCRQHGISMEVHMVSWGQMMERENIRKADCILFEVIFGEAQLTQVELLQFPYSFIRSHLGCDLLAELDQRVNALLREPSRHKREEMLQAVEHRLQETSAIIFLLHKKLSSSFHPSVRGISFNEQGWVDFRNIWLKPRKS
ncbi:SgrR family transcriptional regulator [Paenibacillus alkaliterrae]|uniref:SgrR family transcriptional regulator n=1 Tax=Paenibacillus alkaliterrae TaxID=320909 RepID=UPI001F389D32|nr:SgrR family transcriptional regulator [Paenibacillus alkaliterrae]MCF2938546.1 SgrR family transcriptional regulator [Paenibacillus alkaliterrae]